MNYSVYASERTALRTTGRVQVPLANFQANAQMRRGFTQSLPGALPSPELGPGDSQTLRFALMPTPGGPGSWKDGLYICAPFSEQPSSLWIRAFGKETRATCLWNSSQLRLDAGP